MNRNKKLPQISVLLVLILVASSILTGCGTPAKATTVATEAPTSTPVPSRTPAPTSTATPVPTNTPTLTPTVTKTATPDHTATQAVRATATQAAVNEMVAKELAKYNIDASKGHVAWVMEEPIDMDGGGYAQGFYQPIKELGVVKDFVVQTEITWDTSGGLAGCAYIFRAPKDWDLKTGDFYHLTMIRLANAPTWFIDYFKDGQWQYDLPSGIGVVSKNLLDEKMSKNVVTLDAHGDNLTIYINGVKERTVQNNRIAEGNLAFEVIQNSGTSYCNFSNGWVWVYDE